MADDKTANMNTFGEMQAIMDNKTAVIEEATIQIDGGLAAKVGRLQDAFLQAKQADKANSDNLAYQPVAPAAEEALQEVLDKGKASLKKFTFTSVPREEFEALVNAWPPTEKQKKEEKAQFNYDKLAPRLIAMASLNPRISEEQALAMWTSPDWNVAEVAELYFAAFRANTEVPDIPLFATASGSTSALLSKLAIASNMQSPTQSS